MSIVEDTDDPVVEPFDDSRPAALLDRNFLCLHRHYRMGGFERPIDYVRVWRVGQDGGVEFYELCEDQEAGRRQAVTGRVSFKEAIANLYQLVSYVEREREELARARAVLLLQCKCLIYEATDYALSVPPELGTYFIQCAERFPHQPSEVERQAEELNGGAFADKDDRNRVIKAQLIAALCGANELYRRHGAPSYDRALQLLDRLNRYINEELPNQHAAKRESFGLVGLVQYLIGRVLSAKGTLTESRKAFRRSAEAYVARLRQKEEFLRDNQITSKVYEEKVSVTLRRAALVTAFGDGYLSFISGRITRALESLTLARAALSQNSGRIYLTYVDMLYWACQRAAHSSEKEVIENVIGQLHKCRATLGDLVPGSHYFHRAGLHLALALFHRIKLSPDTSLADYDEAMGYLSDAVAYAGQLRDDEPRNPHLLAAALVTRSRFLSSRYRPGERPDQAAERRHLSELAEAEAAAVEALGVSAGIREMESEARATLGDVYIDLAHLHKNRNRKERFYQYFDESFTALTRALRENRGENIRIDAVCYLRLTKLCLLNPNTKILAHEYFEKWRKIEDQVEHDHWKGVARELDKKLGGPVLLVKAWDSLNYDRWADRLADFLLEEALKKFVAAHEGKDYKPEKLRFLLANHLRLEMGYGKSKVSELIRDKELVKEILRMRARQPEARARKKPRSYSTRQPSSE